MALSDAAIRSAKPRPKAYKLYDTDGLFVIVRPSGGKLWRLKYRHLGKEQQLSLGVFPAVGLKEARRKRDDARTLIDRGQSPALEKKREAAARLVSAANTFKAVAEEYIAKREREGLKAVTVAKAKWLLSLLGPGLGLRAVLRKVETSGRHETAKRLHALAGRVFRFAVATTRARRDISADLRGALLSPKVKHHAAIIDPKGVGALLRAIDGFDGQPTTRWALQIAPHVFVRPGELRRPNGPRSTWRRLSGASRRTA
jgi:hypothetical protein